METFRVSVVIPTIGKIDLLKRAIKSVLNQTYSVYEIIVIVDGFVEEVNNLCRSYNDDRIRVYQLGSNKGGGFARNYGIKLSTGDLIALLDDDDEWFDNKLSIQIDYLSKYKNEFPNIFSFSKVNVIAPGNEYVLPRKPFLSNDLVADYLFIPSFGKIQGFIQTSTFLAPKSLFLKYPFDESLKKHQDWDFVLNLQEHNIKIIYVDEVLSYYFHNNSGSVGTSNRWRDSLAWINSKQNQINRNSYSNFLIIVVLRDMIGDSSLSKLQKIRNFISISKKIQCRYLFSIRYIELIYSLLKIFLNIF